MICGWVCIIQVQDSIRIMDYNANIDITNGNGAHIQGSILQTISKSSGQVKVRFFRNPVQDIQNNTF